MAKINILMTHDKNMRSLKKHWFGLDEVTDVISFPNNNTLMKISSLESQNVTGEDLIGEIVVNEDEVKRNAERFNVTFEKEMARVVAHGVLHLYGYEDDTEEGLAAMRAIEDTIVEKIQETSSK